MKRAVGAGGRRSWSAPDSWAVGVAGSDEKGEEVEEIRERGDILEREEEKGKEN